MKPVQKLIEGEGPTATTGFEVNPKYGVVGIQVIFNPFFTRL